MAFMPKTFTLITVGILALDVANYLASTGHALLAIANGTSTLAGFMSSM